MTTTYYLLRTKNSAVGNGAYLVHGAGGKPGLIANHVEADRFDTLEAAEEYASLDHEELGGFEIEVRNTVE